MTAGSGIRSSDSKCTAVKSDLHHTMLGDRVSVIGLKGFASLGDDSEVTIE